MSPTADAGIVTRAATRLRPDPGRVITRLFLPGEEMPGGDPRALHVIDKIRGMDEGEVATTLESTRARFAHRHRDLDATWASNFRRVAHWLGEQEHMSTQRELLVGAYFTHEISVEPASLCNPSIVPHPDQTGLEPGRARFVMSLRAVSEGHVSAIEFRTGIVGPTGELSFDAAGAFPEAGSPSARQFNRGRFHAILDEEGMDNEAAAVVLDRLEPSFGQADLNEVIAGLHPQLLARTAFRRTVDRIRWIAANNYVVAFPRSTAIDERVLWPTGPTELHGMEDARFVRFVDEDGAATYLGTYTAFDGTQVVPQLLCTADFSTFTVSQLTGTYAKNKGLALFPRRVGGRYLALSRWDRENSSIAASEDGQAWTQGMDLQLTPEPWEMIQTGNCGSPIETDAGWLVLTHGVGPMRVYCIGALLLDLDEPSRVIASLRDPLLSPQEGDREGYVPNVVYSCGALVHRDCLVVPYGLADSAVGLAVVDLPGLLERLLAPKR